MLRINHIIKLAVSGALLLIFSGVLGQEQEDRLLQVLKQELEYNLQELKKQDSVLPRPSHYHTIQNKYRLSTHIVFFFPRRPHRASYPSQMRRDPHISYIFSHL